MTISRTPLQEVILSHNPIYYDLQTDIYLTANGTKQVFNLYFKETGGNPANNDVMTLQFNDFSMDLTFKTSPDDSGLQLPLYDTAVSASFDDVEAALRSNYYLKTFFIITVTSIVGAGPTYGRQYIFTQRNFAQEFRLTGSTSFNTAKAEATITTNYVARQYRAGFKGIIDVMEQKNIAGAREYNNMIGVLEGHPTPDGVMNFDLSAMFRRWNSLKPDFPVLLTDDIYPCPNVMRYFYMVCGESYGSPSLIGSNITDPETVGTDPYKKVILGGLPFLGVPNNTFYDDYIDAVQNKFLTLQVSGKKVVNKACPQYLYHYLNASSPVHVKGTLYFDDGTSTNFNGPINAGALAAEKIYGYRVGYNQLDLDTLISSVKDAMKYEVWLEDGSGNRISEKFMFEVDTRYSTYNHYFFCHNPLGGIDTLWMSGEFAELPEFSGVELQKAVVTNYTEGNIETHDSKLRKGYAANTGWKKHKEEMEHMRILLQSNHVRWLPDSAVLEGFTEPIKINIVKESISDWPGDINNIFGLSFEFKLAHYEWS